MATKTKTKTSLKSSLKNGKVNARDAEVDRLNHLLEGGRPYDVVALEAKNRSNERLISHLNIQIDYLQQKNADLQTQADETWEKTRQANLHTSNLGTRNIELETELETVDRMAQRLQLDKDATIRAAGREIQDTQLELEKAKAEVARLDAVLNNTTADKDDLQVQHLEMQEILEKVQGDKKKLAIRVSKLLATEKDLVLELDRAKHGKNGVRKPKNATAVEALLKQLEEDREYWKQEAELLQKLVKAKPRAASPASKSPTRSRSRSPSKNMPRSRSPSPLKSAKEIKLHSTIKRLEEELAHSLHENEILKTLSSRPGAKGKLSKMEAETLNLESLIQERDELRAMINKFERHMAEIQANVKVLTSERDKLDCMYQKAKEELAYLRKEIVKSPQKPRTSVAAQSVLRRVENERDDAIGELRKTASERDTLRERLKIATNAHLNDRANLEQRIEDLERLLHDVEVRHTETDTNYQALAESFAELESELTESNHSLENVRGELKQQRGTTSHLKSLLSESESSLKSTQSRLSQNEQDLQLTTRKLRQEEGHKQELLERHEDSSREITRLRSSVANLDKAKDSLTMAVDEKTLHIVKMEEDLRHRDRQVSDLRATVSDMDAAIQRLKDVCVDKDREISSLQRQVDDVRCEQDDTIRAREAALRENRRLQDDLATMTRENQNLNQDLADSFQEREDLKNRIQDYLVQIKLLNDQVACKEKERTDLLTQYRTLSVEAEQYQSQSHHLESETSSLKLELMTKEAEIRRLREHLEGLEGENRQHQKALRSYENQISDQTKSAAGLEADLRSAEQHKHSVQQDLFAVRDLCSRLERTKDELQRQLGTKNMDYEKLQALVEDMRSETESLRAQVGSERDNIYSLEGLIQSNREKEYQASLALQEKEAEIQLLKDRISLNESKLDSQNREVTMGRNRLIELEADVDRYKRSLTNERFEKERLAQELRRSGASVPGESRASRSLTTGRSTSPTLRISPGRGSASRGSPSRASPSRSPYRYTSPST